MAGRVAFILAAAFMPATVMNSVNEAATPD